MARSRLIAACARAAAVTNVNMHTEGASGDNNLSEMPDGVMATSGELAADTQRAEKFDKTDIRKDAINVRNTAIAQTKSQSERNGNHFPFIQFACRSGGAQKDQFSRDKSCAKQSCTTRHQFHWTTGAAVQRMRPQPHVDNPTGTRLAGLPLQKEKEPANGQTLALKLSVGRKSTIASGGLCAKARS